MPDGDPNAIITTPKPLNAENTAANTIAGAPTPAPALAPTPGGTTTTAQPPNNAQNTTQIDPTAAANIAHHSMLGKAFSALAGIQYEYHRDHETGKMVSVPVKQTPGQMFRNILAGVIVGGAAGEMGGEHPNNKNFLGGFAKGGAANIKRNEEADQRARENADKDFEASRQLKKDDEQQKTDEAHVALWTTQALAANSRMDADTKEQIDKHSKSVLAFTETLQKGGAKPAQLQLSDGSTSGGTMSAKDFMAEVGKNPGLMNAPDKSHTRIFVDNINGEQLQNISHNGVQLVDAEGKPFSTASATTVTAYDVPLSWNKEMHPLTGKRINELAGTDIISKDDEGKTFELDGSSVLSLATTGQKNYLNAQRANQVKAQAVNESQRLAISIRGLALRGADLVLREQNAQNTQTREERRDLISQMNTADRNATSLMSHLGKDILPTLPDGTTNPAYEQTKTMLDQYQKTSTTLHGMLDGTIKPPAGAAAGAKGRVEGEQYLDGPLKGKSATEIKSIVGTSKNISKEAKEYILNKLSAKPAPAGPAATAPEAEEPEENEEAEE